MKEKKEKRIIIYKFPTPKRKKKKSYITRVPSLHYEALNTRSKNNETLM